MTLKMLGLQCYRSPMIGLRETESLNEAGFSSRGSVTDGKGRVSPIVILAVMTALLLCRLLLSWTTDLAEDEAYYWLWSTDLAAGYYDHPPMIAYWIAAGTALFGKSEFGVRFAGMFSLVLGSYLMYETSIALFRDRTSAWLCVLWLNATLLCNAAAIVATPDTPLAFFTGLTLFCLAKLIGTGRGAWWIAIGSSIGCAAISKYTAALLLPGLFFWLIATPDNRRWFGRAEPYLGALMAAIIVTPMTVWNYEHDWVSFAKQIEHGIKDKPSNAVLSLFEFIGGQAALVTPLIFCFAVFGAGFALWHGWRKRDSRWLLLGAVPAPALVFFLFHSMEQKIQPNWPGFLYSAAILAGVHGFVTIRSMKPIPKPVTVAFSAAPAVALVFTAIAFLQLGFGVLPLPFKKDPTARLKG